MHSSWRSQVDTLRALGLILALAVLCPKPTWAAEGQRNRAVRQGFEMELDKPVRTVFHQRLDLEPGRAALFDWVRPRKGAPTFLFLPGLGFTMPVEHVAYVELSRQGFGIVAMNFSTHVPSVLALGDAAPYFLSRKPGVQDLVDEVNAVAGFLRSRRIKEIIPVSLSYSGMVSPRLKDFPLVIETAPLTSAMAAASLGESIRASVEAFNLFNPFRSQVLRQTMDNLYRNYWSKAVESEDGVSEESRSRVIEGYMAMSRISEGYDAVQAEYAREPDRLFVLGGKERPSLLANQRQTVARLSAAGYKVEAKEIAEAGHLVANEVSSFVEILAAAGKAVACATALKP